MKNISVYDWIALAEYPVGNLLDRVDYIHRPQSAVYDLLAREMQIDRKYSNILLKAPNRFRFPQMDFAGYNNGLTVREMEEDSSIFTNSEKMLPLRRKNYETTIAYEYEDLANKMITNLTLARNDNQMYRDNDNHNIELIETIKTVAYKLKDYPQKYDVVQFLLTEIGKIDKKNDFYNSGFLFKSTYLGARYNLNYIKQLINQLDPKSAGIPADNRYSAQLFQYIENSALYKELMRLNTYLSAKMALNEAWIKTNSYDDDHFSNPNGLYVNTLNYIANNQTFNVNTNKKLASAFAKSYWDNTFVETPQDYPDINYLDMVCENTKNIIANPYGYR